MTPSGIGLRTIHVARLIDEAQALKSCLGFLEVHSENYYGGGAGIARLETLRADFPISLHGVGLSLGRADGLDLAHLGQLKALSDRIDPVRVSEHLSFSAFGGVHVPDLLPLPLTDESLLIVCAHVDAVQMALGRTLLIENPSAYLSFRHSPWPEPEFLKAVCRRTGAKLLLDINNIHVSATNLGFSAHDYLAALAGTDIVAQFHMAGHEVVVRDGETILIDTHGDHFNADVGALFTEALRCFGDQPAMIEWDTDIPALEVLVDEAARLDALRAATFARNCGTAARRHG